MTYDFIDGDVFSREFFNCSEEQLIEELLSELKIPDKYKNIGLSIIAGGAVANILYGKFHNLPKVIKDIDLFFIKNPFDSELEIHETMRDLIEEQMYDSMLSNHYKIEKVYVDGIMNLIEVSTQQLGFDNPKRDLALNIISGFDINCCKAGFFDKELVVSETFVDFLKNKNLKVDHPFTPSSTTTRLFKKGIDLLIPKEKFESEIEYLKQINFFYGDTPYVRTKIIFENYEKKYLPFKEDIDKHYYVMLDEDNLITFFPKGEMDSKMVEYISKYHFKPYITEFRNVWEKLKLDLPEKDELPF